MFLHRLRSTLGTHRGPTVGLVVAHVLESQRLCDKVDFFPLSLSKERLTTNWIKEVDRLCQFFSTARQSTGAYGQAFEHDRRLFTDMMFV